MRATAGGTQERCDTLTGAATCHAGRHLKEWPVGTTPSVPDVEETTDFLGFVSPTPAPAGRTSLGNTCTGGLSANERRNKNKHDLALGVG